MVAVSLANESCDVRPMTLPRLMPLSFSLACALCLALGALLLGDPGWVESPATSLDRLRGHRDDSAVSERSQVGGWDAAPIASRLLVKPGVAALCSAQ